MKIRDILYTLAVLICGTAVSSAQFLINPYRFGVTTPYPYLLSQGFEGTGYDNGESWTPTGSPDPDYATPITGEGSQSMRINVSAATAYAQCASFGDNASVTVCLRLRVATFGSSTIPLIIGRNAANTASWSLNWGSGTALRVQHGSIISAAGTTTIVNGTEYYVWLEYAQGTGLNGVMRCYLSTTTTRPGSPDSSVTNGDGTNQTAILRLGYTGSTTHDFFIDHLRVITGPANTVTDWPL